MNALTKISLLISLSSIASTTRIPLCCPIGLYLNTDDICSNNRTMPETNLDAKIQPFKQNENDVFEYFVKNIKCKEYELNSDERILQSVRNSMNFDKHDLMCFFFNRLIRLGWKNYARN